MGLLSPGLWVRFPRGVPSRDGVMAATADLKSADFGRTGSSPVPGTILTQTKEASMPVTAVAYNLRKWIKRRSFEENDERTEFVLKINIEGVTSGNEAKFTEAISIQNRLDITSAHIRSVIMNELYHYDALTADKFRWKWYRTNSNDYGIFIKVVGRLVYPDDTYDNMISNMEEVDHDI